MLLPLGIHKVSKGTETNDISEYSDISLIVNLLPLYCKMGLSFETCVESET
jgi:hypothetical protein